MVSQFVQHSVLLTDLLPIDHNVHEHACHAIIHVARLLAAAAHHSI